jgi:hypothetical protein
MVPPADISTLSARLAQTMFDFPSPDYVILDKQERVGCIFAELARVRDHLLSRVNVFVLHKPATHFS